MKICFFSLSSRDILIKKEIELITGPDLHHKLLSDTLIALCEEVEYITYSDNGFHEKLKDKTRIIMTYNENNSINIIKKVILINKAIRNSKSNLIYYSGGANGLVIFLSKINRKKTIFNVSSDNDVTLDFFKTPILSIKNFLDILFTDEIIVQTNKQKSLIPKFFQNKISLIKMPIEITEEYNVANKNNQVIWVGSINRVKRPDLYINLSDHLSDIDFVLIGGMGSDNEYNKYIMKLLENHQNIKYKGYLPKEEVKNELSISKLLINTSEYEGFPHVFLEAWNFKVPALTINIDPDGVISQNKAGIVCDDYNELISNLNLLIKNHDMRSNMGENGYHYLINHHKYDIKKYLKIFRKYTN